MGRLESLSGYQYNRPWIKSICQQRYDPKAAIKWPFNEEGYVIHRQSQQGLKLVKLNKS